MVGLSFRMFKGDRIRIRIRGILLGGNGAAGNGGAHNRAGNANAGQGKPVKCYNCNRIRHIARNCTQSKLLQNSNYFKDKMLLMQAQKNVQDLALNEDNIFQADECDAFDSDVDDELTAQSIFMANLSSTGLANPQAGLSNASILSEVYILENAIDHSVTNQDEHEIHNEVQQVNVIDSTSVDMGNSNVIPYEQYLSVDNIFVVQSCASSALNNVCVSSDNDAFVYDQKTKTALELLKTHHVSVIIPSSEEDLELAETTRNKMHAKMNDSACVEKRAEELKANAPPLPVLPPTTVYPPNTPVHLVPRTLPTTSQVNIGLYVITQLFWDFEKTCKKRITPTGITEGEMGFEQTKRCYLTEVIPFFNLLKEHFDGVQKSLVTEVRAMKAVFENLEAEVDQNEIDLKSGEIERKNLLITNENLIAECLSKDVFYTASDSVLNVSRFFDMHDAFTIAQKQHFGNKKPVTSSDAPSFDLLFMIGKLNEQIQSRGNTIRELKEKIYRLTKKNIDADPIFDLKALVSQNKDLTAKLNALHDLNERFKAENAKAQLKDNSKCVTIPDSKPKVLAPGRYPIDVEPIPPRHKNNQEVHLHYIKHLKENIVLWYLDSGCSKHMTGDRSRLKNFVKKFIGTVRFRNNHFGAIMGYGDYVIGDSVIFRVYYVEGHGHNLFSVGQFCDSDLEVAFRKHTCFIRDLDGVDLIKGSCGTNLYTIFVEDIMRSSPICLLSKATKNKSWLWHHCMNYLNFCTLNDLARKDLSINGKKYILVIVDDYSRFTWVKFLRSKDETPTFVINLLKQLQVGLNKTVQFVRTDNGTEFVNKDLTDYYENVGITHEKTVLRTPQQNCVVERRNRTLVEADRTMLIFSKALLFLWAEAVATACYTQNRSLIHTLHDKTPYELVHDKKLDLLFLYVFGALCYPTNDSEDLGKLKAKAVTH
ncbi:retrovirus-related pol polyprotein from transposon TNT 1-94 [Tanacetum coccineum]